MCVKNGWEKRAEYLLSLPSPLEVSPLWCFAWVLLLSFLAWPRGSRRGLSFLLLNCMGPCGLTWCECVLNSTTTTILQYSLPPSSLYFCQEFFTCMLYKKRGFFRGSVSFNKRSIYTSPPLPVLLSMTVDLAFLLGWGYEHQKLMILFRSMRKSF